LVQGTLVHRGTTACHWSGLTWKVLCQYYKYYEKKARAKKVQNKASENPRMTLFVKNTGWDDRKIWKKFQGITTSDQLKPKAISCTWNKGKYRFEAKNEQTNKGEQPDQVSLGGVFGHRSRRWKGGYPRSFVGRQKLVKRGASSNSVISAASERIDKKGGPKEREGILSAIGTKLVFASARHWLGVSHSDVGRWKSPVDSLSSLRCERERKIGFRLRKKSTFMTKVAQNCSLVLVDRGIFCPLCCAWVPKWLPLSFAYLEAWQGTVRRHDPQKCPAWSLGWISWIYNNNETEKLPLHRSYENPIILQDEGSSRVWTHKIWFTL